MATIEMLVRQRSSHRENGLLGSTTLFLVVGVLVFLASVKHKKLESSWVFAKKHLRLRDYVLWTVSFGNFSLKLCWNRCAHVEGARLKGIHLLCLINSLKPTFLQQSHDHLTASLLWKCAWPSQCIRLLDHKPCKGIYCNGERRVDEELG